MTDGNLLVADNVVVSLDYVLRLEDNREIARSEKETPLMYLHGNKNIIPGLENELYGMGVGDEKDVIVSPDMAYGVRDPEEIVDYPRDSFPADLSLEAGEPVMMKDNESGESIRAYVKDIDANTVWLDFNHPLAGETLYFQVKIADLRDATEEELTHGHVHNGSHSH
jgi:FKBP-type peptidyl-prolyl cis-trans isomerase SlyD